jgi:mannose-6-phosphate isomerase-like protein (cupin superfamily)
MPGPEFVRTPLLGTLIGDRNSNFAIHENRDDDRGLPRRGVPLHLHRSEDEAWYVLEGTLRFLFGSKEIDASAGSGVLLPHGTAHSFWNPNTEPVRYLLIVGPKTQALLEALHGPTPPDPTAVRGLYEKFDVELMEWREP